MHLSVLLIDTGTNPDRPRPGRLWLRNAYRIHQRLCMAFPSSQRTATDSEMVQPYCPDDFGKGQVNVPRSSASGFLFRIDPQPGGRAVVLVQSSRQPNWDYAFHNASFLLAAPPQAVKLDLRLATGQQFKFRLVANPTKKVHELPSEAFRQKPLTQNGRRVPVPTTTEAMTNWLTKRAEIAGFSIDTESLSIQPGFVYVNKQRTGNGYRLRSVRYDGNLTVSDPAAMAAAVASGIGPAKGFGFGLLSLARADNMVSA